LAYASNEGCVRAAIMQPYFFPYIGYFQLIAAVDLFIIYDNIKYTKKGWINRNRILLNGRDVPFTLPLKGASDSLDLREREVAADFDRDKLVNQLRGAYAKAPQFKQMFPVVEEILWHPEANLFEFLQNSIIRMCDIIGITTRIVVSSTITIDHELKSQNKVLALCQAMNAQAYVNAIGGMELYSKDEFRARGIELSFIRSKSFVYPQFGADFVPWLSIIDVLMFNSLESIRECVRSNYELI
jgi:WbqC-like protein family